MTVLVLYNAGPLDVSWALSSDKVVAILESFFPAQVNRVYGGFNVAVCLHSTILIPFRLEAVL